MKTFLKHAALLAALATSVGAAQASTLYSGTMTLSASDPVQFGRLTRDGVQSEWSAPKAAPANFNAGLQYHYTTLTLDVTALQSDYESYGKYYQISIDSDSALTFLSAYAGSYDPSNKAQNYLGDPGSSGNYFPGSPRFFQFMLGEGQDLVLVFNESNPNLGLNLPANILVEAFMDTDYTDMVKVPAPASLALALTALVAARSRRKTASALA